MKAKYINDVNPLTNKVIALHLTFSDFIIKGLGFKNCKHSLIPIKDFGTKINGSWTGAYGLVCT